MESGNKPILVSSDTLAEYFCLSKRRILQLTTDGVLKKTSDNARKYDLKENVQRYAQDLQRKANGRLSASGEELKKKKLEAEIALKESQGELHQLKTAIASGEYISVEEVQMDYSKFFLTFKKFATNLPTRVAGIVAGQLDPIEARKLEKDIMDEVNRLLEAFVVAGTRDAPQKGARKKSGRPRKAPKG